MSDEFKKRPPIDGDGRLGGGAGTNDDSCGSWIDDGPETERVYCIPKGITDEMRKSLDSGDYATVLRGVRTWMGCCRGGFVLTSEQAWADLEENVHRVDDAILGGSGSKSAMTTALFDLRECLDDIYKAQSDESTGKIFLHALASIRQGGVCGNGRVR